MSLKNVDVQTCAPPIIRYIIGSAISQMLTQHTLAVQNAGRLPNAERLPNAKRLRLQGMVINIDGMAGEIICGLNPVTESLRSGHRVNRVYLAKESRAKGSQQVVDLAREQRVPFDFVPQAKLNELAGTREHQGIVAAVSPVEYANLDECLAACPKVATLLLLDQVQHPKNLGMLIRTAVGAGVSGVIMTARGGALLDDSVVRASAGTVFHVPLISCVKLTQVIKKLKDSGFWVYGLDASGKDDVFQINWPDRCALVAGNESSGIRHGVAKACDELVRIPLASELDSLNVAVAAGIGLFQVASQHNERK